MTEIKKQPKLKTKKDTDNELYDSTLTTLNKALTDKNPLEQYKIIPDLISLIVAVDSPLQTYYINTLSANHGIEKTVFREALKEANKKIDIAKETKNLINDPQVDKLETFISEYYELRNNIISHDIEVKEKEIDHDFKVLKELDLLRTLRKNHFKIKIVELMETIKSDFTPEFNPVVSYFENLEAWNGVDHIKKLCSYITVDSSDTELFNLHFEKQLVRTVSGALGVNFNKQAFIFVGDGNKNQNTGKSTLVRFLCPNPLLSYYTEELTLDKDGFVALTENMIINIDELSILHKGELNQIKTYMSKDIVKVRLPYERKAVTLKRRASFFGSTNEATFLTDLTGNVRWVAFKIYNINFKYSKEIDINKIWSQAYHFLLNGKDGKPYNGQLTVDEVKENELHNESFMMLPPEMELIPICLQACNAIDTGAVFMTTSEICKLLNTAVLGSLKFNVNGVGRALRKLNFEVSQNRTGSNGYQVKGYWVKII
jgi:predicted P-loop ATPase